MMKKINSGLFALSLIVSSALVQASFTMPTHNPEVGAIGGSHQVAQDGSANYTIPLTMPAGTGGIQPELSINYNSNAGNGALGIGWSVGGLSVIHRCPQTIERDGQIKGIEFTNNDPLCLDGERLVLLSGTHGATNAVYTTENENFSKIEVLGVNSLGPTSFKVSGRDTRYRYYGETADSRIEANGSKACSDTADQATCAVNLWAISKVEDRYTNYMTFHYTEDWAQGDYRIDHIDYTGNTAANVSPQFSVVFDYSVRTDTVNIYNSGSVSKQLEKLDAINIEASTTTLNEYRFLYVVGSGTNTSNALRLDNLEYCKQQHCLPKTFVQWDGNYSSLSFGNYSTPYPISTTEINSIHGFLHLGDWDSDGITDVMHFDSSISGEQAGRNFWYLNDGAFNFNKQENPISRTSFNTGLDGELQFGDWNGDGITDVMYYEKNTGDNNWYINNGDLGFTEMLDPISNTSINSAYGALHLGDWNGDGITDVMFFDNNPNDPEPGRNTWFINDGTLNFEQIDNPIPSAALNTAGTSILQFGDWNGDGITDVMYYEKNSGDNNWYINDGGLGFTPILDPISNTSINSAYGALHLGDWNGDGITDVMFFDNNPNDPEPGRNTWFINDGTLNFEQIDNPIPSAALNTAGTSILQFGDWNGDGITDVMYYEKNSGDNNWYINDGGLGFTPILDPISNTSINSDNGVLHSGDWNGDSITDVMFYDKNIGHNRWYTNQANSIRRIKSIVSGDGITGTDLTTTFEYKPLTNIDSEVYQKGSGATYPVSDVQYPKYVVSKATVSNGVGGEFTSSYSYTGLRSHAFLGDLGFETMTVLNEDTGIATRTTFSQDWQARTEGSILSIETVASSEFFPVDTTAMALAHSDWDSFRTQGVVTSLITNIWQTYLSLDVAGVTSKILLDQNASNGDVPDSSFATCTTTAGYSVAECVARRYHRQLYSTETTKRDLDGSFLNKEWSRNSYDAFDNLTFVYSQLRDESDNIERTKYIFNHYLNGGGDLSNWLFGQASQTFTAVYTVASGGWKHAVAEYEYYPTTGRIKVERLMHYDQPASVYETAKETHHLNIDDFGNALTTEIQGLDFATRTMDTTFTNDGRLVLSTTNALGHTTAYSYYGYNGGQFVGNHINIGKVETVTDPNGLVSKNSYDAFGREVETIAYFGTAKPVSTYTAFEWCDAISDTMICENKTDAYGTTIAEPVYRITKQTQGGAGSHVYVDNIGREVKRASQSMGGRFVMVGNGYDERGHNHRVCEPFYVGDPEYVTKIEYDVLGRTIKSYSPFPSESDPAVTIEVIDTVEYNGLQRISTNDVGGKNQVKIENRDEMGNLVSVIDNIGNEVTYAYDALGNMTMVTAPMLASADADATQPVDHHITTIEYDGLGRKLAMDDPDKGRWTYSYNGLGQLITQTNAKLESSCMVYDVLGRMVLRYDEYQGSSVDALNDCANPGSGSEVSTWVYDTDSSGGAVPKGKGKLIESFNSGYHQSVAYDSTYGYSTALDVTIDGITYNTSTTYDNLHRSEVTTYPTHVAGGGDRLSVRTVYDLYGFATQLLNDQTLFPYQTIMDMDAYGNVTEELLGNGVTTERDYDARTNRLNSITSSHQLDPTGSPSIQNLTFTFDVVGNLTARTDSLQNFYETFDYDALNRLIETHADFGNTDIQSTYVTYDALGNILSKTGVGTYQYGGVCDDATSDDFGLQAGPHAVTRITQNQAGEKNATYCYDANGNMTSGDNRTLKYTAFDKPYLIKRTADDGTLFRTRLYYNENRARYKRNDFKDGVKTAYTYVGDYEKVDFPDGNLEERHYVGGSVMVTIKNRSVSSAGTSETRYLHKDHLGSTTVITDTAGAVEERFSFDAWGKRRASSLVEMELEIGTPFNQMTNLEQGNLTISAFTLKSAVTNKGFTGHEQMDGVGLIHMGGRVYDAEIGRFVSADPFIQDRTSLQNLNRYTYVNNNPLSYTDPSGYFFKKLFKKLWKAIKNIIRANFNFFIKRPLKALGRAMAAVPGLSAIAGAVICNVNAACWAIYNKVMLGLNAAIGLANGQSIGDVAKGFAIGAVASGIPGGKGFFEGGMSGKLASALSGLGKAAAPAGALLSGGIASKASGGKFIDGVKGAAIGLGISAAANRIGAWVQSVGESKATVLNSVSASGADGGAGSQNLGTDETWSVGEEAPDNWNTIVTDGKGGIRVQISENETNKYVRRGIEKHEEVHIKQFYEQGGDPSILLNQPDGLIIHNPKSMKVANETAGYKAELKYLKSVVKRKGVDPLDKAIVTRRIKLINSYTEKHGYK